MYWAFIQMSVFLCWNFMWANLQKFIVYLIPLLSEFHVLSVFRVSEFTEIYSVFYFLVERISYIERFTRWAFFQMSVLPDERFYRYTVYGWYILTLKDACTSLHSVGTSWATEPCNTENQRSCKVKEFRSVLFFPSSLLRKKFGNF